MVHPFQIEPQSLCRGCSGLGGHTVRDAGRNDQHIGRATLARFLGRDSAARKNSTTRNSVEHDQHASASVQRLEDFLYKLGQLKCVRHSVKENGLALFWAGFGGN